MPVTPACKWHSLIEGSFSFTAIGNESTALTCTSEAGQEWRVCYAVDSPLLVKGSLLSPVAITPLYAAGPHGHDTPGCAAASQKPSWILSTITYTNQTEEGDNSTTWQSFNILVKNSATGYQANCFPNILNGDPTQLTPTSFACAGDEFQSFTTGMYTIQTNVEFDQATYRFSLNQTWYCDDTDPGEP